MAVTSMTGFARTADTHEEWSWSWELKSVNAKGLDVRTRLPMGFDGLEVATRGKLSKAFKTWLDHGGIDVTAIWRGHTLSNQSTASGQLGLRE